MGHNKSSKELPWVREAPASPPASSWPPSRRSYSGGIGGIQPTASLLPLDSLPALSRTTSRGDHFESKANCKTTGKNSVQVKGSYFHNEVLLCPDPSNGSHRGAGETNRKAWGWTSWRRGRGEGATSIPLPMCLMDLRMVREGHHPRDLWGPLWWILGTTTTPRFAWFDL